MAAITQTSLLFLGALALLATLGMFVDFGDRWTRVLVSFMAAVLWGVFGISAFDVIILDNFAATRSEAQMPLVFVGMGFALMTGMYALADLVKGIGGETEDVDMDVFE